MMKDVCFLRTRYRNYLDKLEQSSRMLSAPVLRKIYFFVRYLLTALFCFITITWHVICESLALGYQATDRPTGSVVLATRSVDPTQSLIGMKIHQLQGTSNVIR